MDKEKQKRMQPNEVYLSRTEYYYNSPLWVFRKHIDQEERRRKQTGKEEEIAYFRRVLTEQKCYRV
jgi:hypothetical protein